jgi:hypothetical protein
MEYEIGGQYSRNWTNYEHRQTSDPKNLTEEYLESPRASGKTVLKLLRVL